MPLLKPGTEDPPQHLALKRLLHALGHTFFLNEDSLGNWVSSPGFYGASDAMGHFLDEREDQYRHTERDELSLQISGLILIAYRMDLYPGGGVPGRWDVEQLFRLVGLAEDVLVRPIVQACINDASSPLTAEERIWAADAVTLEDLELVLDLNPVHRDLDDQYVHVRTAPINRQHVYDVMWPLLERLTELLVAEDHVPNDHQYYSQVRDQLDELKRSWDR